MKIPLDQWLTENLIKDDTVQYDLKRREVGIWIEVRLFISSTFIDTHSERDILIQKVIPSINRKLAPKLIRVIPVDLRWGVLAEESKNCEEIQKTCLNQIDKCRENVLCTPWFLGLRTDRYGWVQENYMPSHGFEQPELFQWIDQFDKYGKKASITSLECIHAIQDVKTRTEAPTVFIYKREIVPSHGSNEKYPEEYRWIFDFEYVEEEINESSLKYQYKKDINAKEYEKDREDLNKYMQTRPHVKWFDYKAQYSHAKITGKGDNGKLFGVGYVKDLDEFQEQVENDLMESLLANYDSAHVTMTKEVDPIQMETIQHENSVKFKASTFVGRTAMLQTSLDHCELLETPNTMILHGEPGCGKYGLLAIIAENCFACFGRNIMEQKSYSPNIMILHGEPGCGKSGLLAAVADKCFEKVRANGHFLFIHAVDSCPGSNVLESMLRRLQIGLRKFRTDLGETDQSQYDSGDAYELKKKHHTFLMECAKKYPEKLFVIIVDAVNQFHSGLGAWDMWWLPTKDAPNNLKFIISTLNEENETFLNATNVCPDARCILVGDMSTEDLQEMIKMTLSRFNKKLTDYDDSLLGNQMEKLLSKSKSPLYLVSACEALRTFGIFERVTQYIDSLPNDITDLFSFLLDEWTKKYGKLFVEDIAGLLCVSKDGLLENQINDLLQFKELNEKGDGELLYDANFALIYDSVSPFLAAGGGGYLRFFHDQLKYTVRKKFMNESFEQATHKWLRDFYQDIIGKQCCETPQAEPPAYFEHTLEQLVYHQIKAHNNKDEPMEVFKKSLRNIYFVKNRIMAGQHQNLNDEYCFAMAQVTNEEDFEALKQWSSFVQLYTSHIREFPMFCYNMAITQAPNSFVVKDTSLLDAPIHHNGYPLYWSNIPAESDRMILKYPYGGVDCSTTDTKGDIVAIANGGGAWNEKVVLLDQSSGELIHELDIKGTAVCLSKDGKYVFVGDEGGKLSLWNVSTATMESSPRVFESSISWLHYTEKFIIAGFVCATYLVRCPLWIAIIDKKTCEKVRSWFVDMKANALCYNERMQVIFSAHDYSKISSIELSKESLLIGWDLKGNKLCETRVVGEIIYSLACHPAQNKILSASDEGTIKEWSVTKSSIELCKEIKDLSNKIKDLSNKIKFETTIRHRDVCAHRAVYDHAGERILSVSSQRNSLKIYNSDGELLDELTGDLGVITKITLVPNSNKVITMNWTETILWELPDTSVVKDKSSQIMNEEVRWCAFTVDGSQFLTATKEWLRVYDAATYQLKISEETCYNYNVCCAIHPDGKHLIIISSMTNIAWYTINDLKMISEHQVIPYDDGMRFDEHQVRISDDGILARLALSKDGAKLLVINQRTSLSGTSFLKVFDVSDVTTFKEVLTISEGLGKLRDACAISDDGSLGCIVTYFGGKVLDLNTGKKKGNFDWLNYSNYSFVKFYPSSDRVLHASSNGFYLYDPKTGDNVCFNSDKNARVTDLVFIHNNELIVAVFDDGTLRMYKTETREIIYTFFNHRAANYTSLAVHPSEEMYLAANMNSSVYILKTERNT